MLKRLSVLLIVFLFMANAYAQTVTWTYRINEIRDPGLSDVSINVTLLASGSDYVTIDVNIDAGTLATFTTNTQRLTYIRSVVEEKLQRYITIYNTISKIKQYEGQEIAL